MKVYIKGDGTSSNPLRPGRRAREIIRVLIGSPRASMKDIHAALEAAGLPDALALTNRHLQEEPLAHVLRFRVNLPALRHLADGDPEAAGTCFLQVLLKNEQRWTGKNAFTAALSDIHGVVEWDEIGGNTTDFLVRVAGKSDGLLVDKVSKALESLPQVHAVTTLQIRRSGIVDNFDPEHFLRFDKD